MGDVKNCQVDGEQVLPGLKSYWSQAIGGSVLKDKYRKNGMIVIKIMEGMLLLVMPRSWYEAGSLGKGEDRVTGSEGFRN